jgi:hypothetical protein
MNLKLLFVLVIVIIGFTDTRRCSCGCPGENIGGGEAGGRIGTENSVGSCNCPCEGNGNIGSSGSGSAGSGGH